MEEIMAGECAANICELNIYPVETYPAGAACSLKPYENSNIAEAYVPQQQYTVGYSPADALARGTLFPELDKPYCGCAEV